MAEERFPYGDKQKYVYDSGGLAVRQLSRADPDAQLVYHLDPDMATA
ncbi:MAG: hypothetical protein ACLUD2_08190 [Clostridium sp.]